MNENAMISVIVPVYNVENVLNRCIDSLLEQSCNNFEIVLIDDGSSDNSSAICDDYAKKDNRIRVYHQKNGGVSAARNNGLRHALGDYICFVDSDDSVHRDYLKELYNAAESNKADIVVCNCLRCVEKPNDTELTKISFGVEKYEALNKVARDFLWVVPWAKLYKKTLFYGIEYPEGQIHEDEAVIHELFYKTDRVVYLDDKMYYYYKADEKRKNITAKYYHQRLDVISSLNKRLFFYENKGEKNLYRLTCIEILYQYAFLYLMASQSDDNISDINYLKKENKKFLEKCNEDKKISILLHPRIYILKLSGIKKILLLWDRVVSIFKKNVPY